MIPPHLYIANNVHALLLIRIDVFIFNSVSVICGEEHHPIMPHPSQFAPLPKLILSQK